MESIAACNWKNVKVYYVYVRFIGLIILTDVYWPPDLATTFAPDGGEVRAMALLPMASNRTTRIFVSIFGDRTLSSLDDEVKILSALNKRFLPSFIY